MKKREARTTITDLAAECNRLEAENEALRERLTAVTLCLGGLVGLSSGLHARLIDEYFQLKQLEELHEMQSRTQGSLTSDKPTNKMVTETLQKIYSQ